MGEEDGVRVPDPPEELVRLFERRLTPSTTPEFTGPSGGWPPQVCFVGSNLQPPNSTWHVPGKI